MSNFIAIAAVTTTLQSILFQEITADPDLTDTTISLLPLDKARGNNTNNQLNLFLYQVGRNSAWSNGAIPGQSKPGETVFPPLPLNLYYLMTAFGRDNDATLAFGHELLGKAMSILHDRPILNPADIRAATAGTFPRSDLDGQVEHIRVTFQPLSLDELSKLWTGFAMQLRLSAAYVASVALVESTQAARTPLPTLTRGRADSGTRSVPNLTPPFPAIESITLPNGQASALLNNVVVLNGHDLDGSNVSAFFNHPLWSAPVEIPIAAGPNATATAVQLTIPNDPVNWPAGIYTVWVMVQRSGDSYRRSTNTLSLSLAPAITIAPPAAPAGNIVYTVTASPQLRPDQRVSLLFGSQEVLADAFTAQTATVTFHVTGAVAGDYFVRLRVDGVDSLLVNNSVSPPLFDPSQKVTVT